MSAYITLIFFIVIAPVSPSSAQTVLFDFDNLPVHSSLPGNLTVDGITAHFSATGQGFSIQDNNAPGVPAGFTGNVIWPNSVYLADLLVGFDQTLTDFSIMYACQELGCDDAATMRVTAYMNADSVGVGLMTARNPGTWPIDTLRCSFPQGFNRVVVHYYKRPPTCADWGPIFISDNMVVTALNVTAILNPIAFSEVFIIPNPVSPSTTISFALLNAENIHVSIYDATGRLIKNLFEGHLNTGEHKINWDAEDEVVEGGVYFLNLTGENFSQTCKLIVVK